jgi:hypothetical protein
MVGGQLKSCPPDPSCPVVNPPSLQLTEIVRRVQIQTTGFQSGLMYINKKIERGFPICVPPRVEDTWVCKLDGFFGGLSFESIDSNGTTFQEFKWGNPVVTLSTSSAGIYKRPGTNIVLATGVLCTFRRYAFRGTGFTVDTQITDLDTTDTILLATTQQINCSPSGVCDPPDVDIFVNIIKNVITSSGITANSGTLNPFNYLPVATANFIGLNVTIVSGFWKVSVAGGVLRFLSPAGVIHDFSGTLTSVVAAVNATSGGSLFTAAIPVGVVGGVVLISDLKDFTSDFLGISCVKGLPLIEINDDIAPSSVSQHHFRTFDATLGIIQLRFDSTAIASGFTDDKAGYISWLSQPRFPKWMASFDITAFFGPITSSGSLFSTFSSVWYTPTNTTFLDNWSTLSGVSTETWSFSTNDFGDNPFELTTFPTPIIIQNFCSSAIFTPGCSLYSNLCGSPGFSCTNPSAPFPAACLQDAPSTTEPTSFANTWSGDFRVSGIWVLQ